MILSSSPILLDSSHHPILSNPTSYTYYPSNQSKSTTSGLQPKLTLVCTDILLTYLITNQKFKITVAIGYDYSKLSKHSFKVTTTNLRCGRYPARLHPEHTIYYAFSRQHEVTNISGAWTSMQITKHPDSVSRIMKFPSNFALRSKVSLIIPVLAVERQQHNLVIIPGNGLSSKIQLAISN